MAMIGSLAEFSLAEIFYLVYQGRKTGLLSIQAGTESRSQLGEFHYIALQDGHIVAVADGLEGQGLLKMISQRRWLGLNNQQIFSLVSHCPADTPIGLYLTVRGALQAEQLKLVFYAQVTRRVCALFKVRDGEFKLDPSMTLPKTEMTGLRLPATEATLLGLRVLRDWQTLTDKLPQPTSALSKVVLGRSNLRLTPLETEVWDYGNGIASLAKIAEQMGLPLEEVQRIAFRLIVVGLAQEIPQVHPSSTILLARNLSQPSEEASGIEETNNSFVQGLVGFLRSKF